MPKVTFIIPTIGRESLQASVQCLLNQTVDEWLAIIIFDGIEPNFECDDPRITIVSAPKLGEGKNSAGSVRNHGIAMATTEWIAFLDDDDKISNNYTECLLSESHIFSKQDLIIFRMKWDKFDGQLLPRKEQTMYAYCEVGISFAFKKHIFDSGIQFIPSHVEDFKLLEMVREKGYKMMISPHVKYFVRTDAEENYPIKGRRGFINL